ncbi:MAG: TIGR04282 family arsenosugar biosynthesis glycosyltransferase [Hyphomicrobiaceae bacterium]|nr:TIGR04282 family arsenosugar biosynthesis glycosyltransferase [Hyphomicrobiaceae bacterium]
MHATTGIGIICKTPREGASKTRLHGILSPRAAAELAGCFLTDVSTAIGTVPAETGRRGYAIYAPEGSEAELRQYLPADFGLHCRRDSTLGVVLQSATRALIEDGHDCAILVNADSPTLPTSLIERAMAELRAPGDRVVLGPATDGGYYLIGLKQPHGRVFEDITWSTASVLSQTIERAGEIGLPVVLLPPWYDVDDAATLAVLLDEVLRGVLPAACEGRTGGAADATRRFIASHPELDGMIAHAVSTGGAG